ncbi:PREDICTED: GRIP and coiled-coil domain-containing protein 2-like [Acropora digitifera]|uniref:GRIP and coiled-coil domain-containing protein 2-like n=1 Tax=Acropora digitifera TaxID=70779 RepID=UPI00077B0CA0|nr:PREDICTED: GRIP and coiled-coil domain-containing protein 2-like [Acropora digitifera]
MVLESLPKDELIKFVRKQNAVLKQSKAKCDELTSQLEKERSEINRLENEKKDWLSRGVHAEFEKKDKEFEEDFSAVVMERNGLQESLRILQQEYQSVVKESKKYKDALELDALKDDKTQDQLRKDNQDLLKKIEVLESEKEQTQNALLKLEQENNQLSNTCKVRSLCRISAFYLQCPTCTRLSKCTGDFFCKLQFSCKKTSFGSRPKEM